MAISAICKKVSLKMKRLIGTMLLVSIFSMLGVPQSVGLQKIDTSRIDGIRIEAPTRVEAGKPFQVKVISKRSNFKSGYCWMDQDAYGFNSPSYFRMSGGRAAVKIMPIYTGTGQLSFSCGVKKLYGQIGSSIKIYIAP